MPSPGVAEATSNATQQTADLNALTLCIMARMQRKCYEVFSLQWVDDLSSLLMPGVLIVALDED